MKAIFAADLAGGFGLRGGLPWPRNRQDMDFFKMMTMGKFIAMGRNTYNTLPKLQGREPIVVTSKMLEDDANVVYCRNNVGKVLKEYEEIYDKGVMVIGGAALLQPKLLEQCDEIYFTLFKDVFDCDTRLSDDVLLHISQLKRECLYEDEEITICRRY